MIRTTLDSRIQDSVNTILRLDYPRMQQFEARNAAAMVVDLENGHVLAYIGSVDYYSKHGGAINCAALPFHRKSSEAVYLRGRNGVAGL